MNIHLKATPASERRLVVSSREHPSEELELELWQIASGRSVATRVEGRESVIVILGGRCSLSVEGGPTWESLGERENVFAGAATAAYMPPGSGFEVVSEGGAELALFTAPAEPGGEAYVIRPGEVEHQVRGRGSWEREVHTILGASRPAQRLTVGETFNVPGAWSSYPPHKHDRQAPPEETLAQEIYHFRLQPEQGFGVQRVYSAERGFDQLLLVENGDTVIIPFGYHPVVAAPGYHLYYLWALAGASRMVVLNEDPMHAWVAGSD